MMDMRNWLVLVACVLCGAAWALPPAGAFDAGEIEIKYTNGVVKTLPRALERQHDGAWRLRFRTEEMSGDMTWVDFRAGAVVSPRCDGYWVIGDGRYGRLNREAQVPPAGATKIQETKTPGRLPIFGMKTPTACCVGIVKGLRCECEQIVRVKNGVTSVFVRFWLKKIEFNPYEDAVVDFYPLTGADANYSGMARLYRRHQLTAGGCVPLRERIKGNPALEYATGSIFVRYKFGRCDRRTSTREQWLKGPMPPLVVDHTFADYVDFLKRCKAAGLDQVDQCMVGFQPHGHDGPFPDLFPADEAFGGEKGMREAIGVGKSLGYRMSIHLNQHNFYKNARRWCEADVSKGLDGKVRLWPLRS